MAEKVLDFFEVTTFEVDSSKLLSDDIRFNADYFLLSDNIVYNENIKFTTLSEFAKVIFPGIFRRIIVDNPEFGIPFITTSGMMEYSPNPEKFLSKELTPNLSIYRVEQDWILVSRSGTIGNTVFTSKNLTRFAITEDALRVIPFDKNQVGFLYFYISSDYGKDLIVGKKGGAVVDHIYEEDLLRLHVPIVSDKITTKLQEKYLEVKTLREAAHDLLQEANRMVYEYNNLPLLDIADAKYYDAESEIPTRIISTSEISSDNRLDGHFYNPFFQLAENTISDNAPKTEMLGDLCFRIFMSNRFTRNYVQEEFGIPFISTKNTLQTRPTEWKYLSKTEIENISELLLEEQWILLARSGSLGGTFGKVSFVWKNFEGFAGSEHIIRIVAATEKIDPAYLYAFLSSEYGYNLIIKQRHGALIDEIAPEHLEEMLIPIPKEKHQKIIGEKVRLAYEKRREAIRLEDEAQEILKQFLTE